MVKEAKRCLLKDRCCEVKKISRETKSTAETSSEPKEFVFAFRKEERLRIMVAEGTGVREAPWAVVVQNQQLHIKEDTIKTVCSVPPHDLSVFH